jgi:hypothetical protein
MCPTPGIMKGPRMIKLDSLHSKTNDELVDLIELDVLDVEADAKVRRILKDRLEGLDEVVKSEMLHDKIVSA